MSETRVEVLFHRTPDSAPVGLSSTSGSPSSSLCDSKDVSGDDPSHVLGTHFVSRPLTPVDRLFYPRKSRLSRIQDKIQQPDKVLPAGKLPIWDRLRLGDKIPTPNIPNHRLVWTRGKICQNLHRDSPFFDIGNPYNGDESYDALHDEATESYFQSPSVQKLLHEQGLITPRGSVPCTLPQFNNWRKYLNATIHIRKINKALDQIMEIKEWNFLQMKLIQDFGRQEEMVKRNSHRKQRQVTARENQVRRQLETLRRYESGLKEKEERMKIWKMELSARDLDRILRLNHLDEKRNSQLAQQRKKESSARGRLLLRILEKQMEAERRLLQREKMEEKQMEEIFENKIQAHSKVQEMENQRKSRVVDEMWKETREAIRVRQEITHKQHLKLQKKGKGQDEKLGLMAKYFVKWTRYAVKRQLERCSETHCSIFHLPTTLTETVLSLNQQLGISPGITSQTEKEQPKGITKGNEFSTQLSTKVVSQDSKVSPLRKTKSLGGPGLKERRPKTAVSLAELEHRKKQQSVEGPMQFLLAEGRRVAGVKRGEFKKGQLSTGGGDGSHGEIKSKNKDNPLQLETLPIPG